MMAKAGKNSGERASEGPDVMRRPPTAVTGDHGVDVCRHVFANQFGWIFRELAERDYGIDAWVEVVGSSIHDEHVTGRLIAIQIKDGKSYHKGKETADGWRFNTKLKHLSYWLGYSMPVLVVIVAPNGDAHWQLVSNDTVTEFGKGFRLEIPRANSLDGSAKDDIAALAWTKDGLIESLPGNYAVLPPDAVGPLKRAEAVDPLGAARMADRLAQGREQPGLTVAGVLALNPSWVRHSPGAQELWMAVGGYAHEHHLPGATSSAAHARAAQAMGHLAARARAFAGISLLFTDDINGARAHLEAAREGEQVLLADFGLAVVDLPQDSAPAIDVPESIANASAAELDAEPTVLNFLAENAKRAGKLNDAIELRRRAHSHSQPGSGIELELARDLIRRATLEGRHAGRDARQALAHAQAVAIGRRRWSGPSGEAVAVATAVLTMTDNTEQAVIESTSRLDGGKAEPRESTDRALVRAGASAALATKNDIAFERYLAALDDNDVVSRQMRCHLADLLSDETGRIAATGQWEQIADDAAAIEDREALAVAVAHLAHLGVWSAHADYLVDKHLLAEPEQELLRAVCLIHHDRDAGLERLRELAQTHPHAAIELVQVLTDNTDEALAESATQLARWHTWTLIEQRIALLREGGDNDAAERLARDAIDDGVLSVGARQAAAASLVRRLVRAERLEDAAEAAQAGLGLSDDEDELAWLYTDVLHRQGDADGARAAIARYELHPVTDREADLWIKLHVGNDRLEPDPRVLIDIIERLPNGRYRSWVRALLLHETLTPAGPKPGLAADVSENVRSLAAEAGVVPENPSLTLPTTPPAPPDPGEYRKLAASTRLGRTPLADIATWCDRPYTSALLDPPSTVLAAGDGDEPIQRYGRETAAAAADEPGWIVDLSTLAVLSHLDSADVSALLSQLPPLTLAAGAIDDIAAALEELRGLPAAYRLQSSSGGIVTGSRIHPRRAAELTAHTQRMNELAHTMNVVAAPATVAAAAESDAGPLRETIDAAARAGMTLWCDDRAARQRARGRGIVCFGTLDLLEATMPSNLREQLLTLARARVIDVPLTADELIALARESDWDNGPAHTALASTGLWSGTGTPWRSLWQPIADAAGAAGWGALSLATAATLNGVLNQASPEQSPRRYLDVIICALMAAHRAALTADGLLNALAERFNATVVPDIDTIRVVLTRTMADAGVPAAPLAACEVLGIEFTV